MTNDKGIFIKNIYYMLTYAFQILNHTTYEEIASEEFDYIDDLFAAILAKGISRQLKQGLHKEYITKQEALPTIRGKINMQDMRKNDIMHTKLLFCEYDELSENNIYNQILKTTILVLLRTSAVSAGSVKAAHRAELKKVMPFFEAVDEINPKTIQWNLLQYQRNNQNYEMLINICYFILDGMLQTTETGNFKMSAFSDSHMARLYEKFILEYYRKHHTYLSEVRAAQIKWNLDKNVNAETIQVLPIMQTDIMLRFNEKILIIDAKYYGHTMQEQFDKYTLHSNHLYQIFTYVKNQDVGSSCNVSGMLLYAKTNEEITPDCEFSTGGNRISVKTLDLNNQFIFIAQQLDAIAESHFGTSVTEKITK